ncbi:cysteine desulfurase NifS [Salipaludibacillus neizhouensis]|uniref:Cysteine desulfurase NifS n=1 Tax=Salipaludibacillus neizhouensis TaxID=885475 RepID=A0A3A9KPW8_9BACI|nr:cysteine desulfurase family protein [Salipaludibacillus neizhouensis]RKL66736.1 cysteine desulfurase NifS [Salipaludibacillus neizhouensis]
MIYFDNSATTRPYPEVVDTFSTVARTYFANPSSLHPLGKEVEQLLHSARQKVAESLEVEPQEIVFTSGGTEGNNISIKGIASQYRDRGNHIITSTIEHSATYDACKKLEKEGFRVTYLLPNEHGVILKSQVEEAITDHTILVSLIHVNNEIGSIQPIEEIGQLLKTYPRINFHVDNVQGIAKVTLPLKGTVDLCTMSAHKFHGLNGNGILYVRKGLKIDSLFTGGSQEQGIRPGTENVAGVVAMTKALRLALDQQKTKIFMIEEISRWIEQECEKIEGVFVNSPKKRAPHILNISVPHLKPEVIVQALAEKEVYISTKSACSSKKNEPSRVLISSGYNKERSSSAIRLSFSFENTMEEAIEFMDIFKEVVISMKKVVKK